jgi:hypothetical protein
MKKMAEVGTIVKKKGGGGEGQNNEQVSGIPIVVQVLSRGFGCLRY